MMHADNIIAMEAAILGSVLIDNAAWAEVSSLDETCFSLKAHQQIFRRMQELFARGEPVDVLTMSDGRGIEVADLSKITNDVVEGRDHLRHHVTTIREDAARRKLAKRLEDLSHRAAQGMPMDELRADLGRLSESCQPSHTIRNLNDIPRLLTMKIAPVEWLVDDLIPCGELAVVTGLGGSLKSILLLKLAIAVATGGTFLGRACTVRPVLIIDYENAGWAAQWRLRQMCGDDTNLSIWGKWCPIPPPKILEGQQVLVDIAKASRPLLIIDPLRNGHYKDEDSSTEMLPVLDALESFTMAGATVFASHHLAKKDASFVRGTVSLFDRAGVFFKQTRDRSTEVITLECRKNRTGREDTFTLRFNPETFELTDSSVQPPDHPLDEQDAADIAALQKIIAEKPGMSQRQVLLQWKGRDERARKLLKDGLGTHFNRHKQGSSWLYEPCVPVSPTESGTQAEFPASECGPAVSPRVPPLRGTHSGTHSRDSVTTSDTSESEEAENLIFCYVHGQDTTWWQRPDGSYVCQQCTPDPSKLRTQ